MTGAGWVTIRSATFAVSMLEPPPTDTKPSTPRVAREVGRVLERVERRLDARAVVDDDLDALGLDRRAHAVGMPGAATPGSVTSSARVDAEALELPAGVGRGAGAELDRRRLEREDVSRATAWIAPRTVLPTASRRPLRTSSASATSSRDADLRGPLRDRLDRALRRRARLVVRPADTARGRGRACAPAPSRRGDRAAGRQHRPGRRGRAARRRGRPQPARLDALGRGRPRRRAQVDAGAGATLAALQERARAAGLDAGIDFGARDSATVGGLVAADAGGMRALRHGTVRARVAGLEAVLADGRRDRPTRRAAQGQRRLRPGRAAGRQRGDAGVDHARALAARAAAPGARGGDRPARVARRGRRAARRAAAAAAVARGGGLLPRRRAGPGARPPRRRRAGAARAGLRRCSSARRPTTRPRSWPRRSATPTPSSRTRPPSASGLWRLREAHTEAIARGRRPAQARRRRAAGRLAAFADAVLPRWRTRAGRPRDPLRPSRRRQRARQRARADGRRPRRRGGPPGRRGARRDDQRRARRRRRQGGVLGLVRSEAELRRCTR